MISALAVFSVITSLTALFERGHTPNPAFFEYSKTWTGRCAYADVPDADLLPDFFV
jgi:hypothetical protein